MRSRAYTSKPARQLRTAWTDAWEAPESPGTLPMPLQFILNSYASQKMGAKPPRELWRHRIGPGWSSFAVVGNRAFTQEQRGDQEAVVCYDASTGVELWAHCDQAHRDCCHWRRDPSRRGAHRS